MILHNDKENFDIAIRAASRYFNISLAIIEKIMKKVLENFYLNLNLMKMQ